MTDGYNGNSLVKRDGVTHNYTKEEITEYQKCMSDPAYFAKTYVKIINLDKGLVPFDLYPYQEEMFNHFNNNRFSVVLACRQSGKSISSVVSKSISESTFEAICNPLSIEDGASP